MRQRDFGVALRAMRAAPLTNRYVKNPQKKGKPMKQLLSLVSAMLLVATVGYAQTSTDEDLKTSTSSANTGLATNVSEGKVVNYKAGTDITIDEGKGSAPSHYVVATDARVIGPNGEERSADAVKPNSVVKLHFSQEGGKPTVDQIRVQDTR